MNFSFTTRNYRVKSCLQTLKCLKQSTSVLNTSELMDTELTYDEELRLSRSRIENVE